jgi:hypothetical protein
VRVLSNYKNWGKVNIGLYNNWERGMINEKSV